MFSYVFLKNGHEKRLKYSLMGFVLYSHTLVQLLLEECALKSKFVTKFNFLYQNIYRIYLQRLDSKWTECF